MSPTSQLREFELPPGRVPIVGAFIWRTPDGRIAMTSSNLPDNIGVIVGANGRRAIVRVFR